MPNKSRTVDETRAGGRPSAARRALIIALLLALLYPLSLGPVCWTMARLKIGRTQPRLAHAVSRFYEPLAPWVLYGPPVIQKPLRWWIGVGMRPPTLYHSLPDGIVWSNPGYTYTLWHY